MTTLTNRPKTALLVIDVQNGVVADAYDRDTVVANIATLVDKARVAGIDVVWIQHNNDDLVKDTENWQFVPELKWGAGEPVVQKHYADAFEETDLESVLAAGGIGRVYVAGAQTDECVRSTLHGALVRGYDATLVGDAHTTDDMSSYGAPTPDKVIAHTNLYWQYHTAPGRIAGTVSTADADFGAPVATTVQLKYHTVTPRIFVTDVTAAVDFLKTTFGATGEIAPGRPAEIQIGDSLVMVSEAGERELFPAFLYVYVDDADAAYRRAIDAGAVSVEEPSDTPYGDRRAMVRDPFGNTFQIAHRAAV
ncbi:hypothetical protein GCM10009765_66600 [Fodinicola feengrottensis]|uniref:VOC domain-containing protein n=1 Tax=Fodinicola feengrottensis TaxID=435914 RepID=A0ABP4UPI7_9ACTN